MLAAKSSVSPAALGPSISASVYRNPSASSSSWPGVRIVTASGSPSTRISSGSSTATSSSAPSRSTVAREPCTLTFTPPTLPPRAFRDAPGGSTRGHAPPRRLRRARPRGERLRGQEREPPAQRARHGPDVPWPVRARRRPAHAPPRPPAQGMAPAVAQLAADPVRDRRDDERGDEDDDAVDADLARVGEADRDEQPVGRAREEHEEHPREEADPDRCA